MAKTQSNNIPLRTKAIDFTLYDVISKKEISLKNLQSPIATVIMFICNHCPFVKHIQTTLIDIARTYIAKNITFIAINANDVIAYPEDEPDQMAKIAHEFSYPFPYMYDETQSVARAYQAACTPDFYIYDKDLKLSYHGQFDDSRPGNNIPVTGQSLTGALECLIHNQPILEPQKPSIGCNIKWK